MAQSIDALVIAPATANVLAKLARGYRRRFSHHTLSRNHRSGDRCSGHERQHVGARRHAGKYRDAACARRARRLARRGLSRLRHDGRGPASLASKPLRAPSPTRWAFAMTSTAKPCVLVTAGNFHLRGSGPGALSHQSFFGENGLRSRRRGRATWRSRGVGERPHGAGCAAGRRTRRGAQHRGDAPSGARPSGFGYHRGDGRRA